MIRVNAITLQCRRQFERVPSSPLRAVEKEWKGEDRTMWCGGDIDISVDLIDLSWTALKERITLNR